MRVILLQDMRGLGKRFDVKDVAEGYARNFLLPRGIAKIATSTDLASLTRDRIAEEREAQASLRRALDAARMLRGAVFAITVKANAKGGIFGSIGAEEIMRAIQKEKPELRSEKIDIALAHPIKTIGEHAVSLLFAGGGKSEIIVKLLPQP